MAGRSCERWPRPSNHVRQRAGEQSSLPRPTAESTCTFEPTRLPALSSNSRQVCGGSSCARKARRSTLSCARQRMRRAPLLSTLRAFEICRRSHAERPLSRLYSRVACAQRPLLASRDAQRPCMPASQPPSTPRDHGTLLLMSALQASSSASSGRARVLFPFVDHRVAWGSIIRRRHAVVERCCGQSRGQAMGCTF